jgi:hypothetical protein
MKPNTLSSFLFILKFILFLCVPRGGFNKSIVSPCRHRRNMSDRDANIRASRRCLDSCRA